MEDNTTPSLTMRVAVQMLGNALCSLGQEDRAVASVLLEGLALCPGGAGKVGDKLAGLIDGAPGSSQHKEQTGNLADLQTVAQRAAESGASERTQRKPGKVAATRWTVTYLHGAGAGGLQRTSRRRLAPNVLCLFEDDRPPVINERRRGRQPRNVTSIWSRPALKPGDYAEILRSDTASNIGKRVRVVKRCLDQQLPPGQWWEIEAVSVPIETVDATTRRPSGKSMSCLICESVLRRVSRFNL